MAGCLLIRGLLLQRWHSDRVTSEPPSPFALAMLDDPLRNLILVRHGQQLDRTVRDSPLSDLGHRQAAAVGEFLAPDAITAVWCSQLSRAHDTGVAIATHHQLQCQVDERLREIELGQNLPEGKRSTDLLSEEELRAHGERFVATRRWDSFAFSETGDELRERVGSALDDIAEAHPQGNVVVACHGGVINAIVAMTLGVSQDFFARIAHASVTRVRVGTHHSVLGRLNEVTHLRGDLHTW